MKKIILFSTILLSVAFFRAPHFEQLIWADSFETATSQWKQSNNAEEVFLFQTGSYLLWRKNAQSPALLFPENGDVYEECRVDVNLILEKEARGSSAGVILLAYPDGSSAWIAEINDQQEYRIRKVQNNTFIEISGNIKSQGWEKSKVIEKTGLNNRLSLKLEAGLLRFSVNGSELFTREVLETGRGKCGLYIGPSSKASIRDIQIYVSDEEAVRIKNDRNSSDPARSALTDVIISLRKTINEQNKELDSLRKVSGRLQTEINKWDNSPKNVKKLTQELETLKKEKTRSDEKVKQLEKENKSLQAFKQNIQKTQGGDAIIQLSTALADEKTKNADLQKEIKDLKNKIALLEAEKK